MNSLLWSIVVTSVFSFALLSVAHWFPYKRELSNVERYIIGTMCMLVPSAVWTALNNFFLHINYSDLDLYILLCFNIFFSGLAVIIGYRIDKRKSTK